MISRSVSEATPSQARLPEQYVLSRGGVEVNPKQLLNAVIALGGFDAMDEPKWRQVEQRFELPPLDRSSSLRPPRDLCGPRPLLSAIAMKSSTWVQNEQ